MFVPEFIPAQSMRAYSFFTVFCNFDIVRCIPAYSDGGTSRFFEYDYQEVHDAADSSVRATLYHVLALAASVVMIGVLAELLAVFMEEGMRGSGLPLAIPAVLVATVSALRRY